MLKKLKDFDVKFTGIINSVMAGLLLFTKYNYKNCEEGLAFLEKAANLGNINALNNLGFFHKQRGAVGFKKAFDYYQQAAKASKMPCII